METSSSSGRGGEGTWTAVGGTGPWALGVQQEAQPLQTAAGAELLSQGGLPDQAGRGTERSVLGQPW